MSGGIPVAGVRQSSPNCRAVAVVRHGAAASGSGRLLVSGQGWHRSAQETKSCVMVVVVAPLILVTFVVEPVVS